MNDRTDLKEVVALLPASVAEALLGMNESLGRKWVLSQIRTAVSTWESRGLVFDPVTLSVLIETYANQAITAWTAMVMTVRSGLTNAESESKDG